MVHLCPNLRYLEIELEWKEDLFADVVLREGASWPPLRFLNVKDIGDLTSAMGVLGKAHSLVIQDHVRVSDTANAELRLLLDVMEKTSPTAAFVLLEVGPQPMRFGGEVTARAPRLRILELKLTTEALTLEDRRWLVRFTHC